MRLSTYWGTFWAWALSFSVRVKIMGIALGMVLLLGLGLTYQIRGTLLTTLREELRQRGAAIASDVAGRGADLLLTDNLFGLHELLRETVEHNADVRYAFVTDRTGVPAAHTFGAGVPPALLEANRPGAPASPRLQVLKTEEGFIYDAAVSILEGRAGVARVGMTERRIRAQVASTTRTLLTATALVSLVGVVAAFVLTSVLTRPISELVDVAHAIGRGEFSRRARIWARDEVGGLSGAFNAMAADLEASRREIEESHRRLVRRNEELSALNAIALTVGRSLKLEDILEGALGKVLEVTRLRAGWIVLHEGGDRGGLVLAAHRGLTPAFAAREAEHPLEGCVCAAVLEKGEPQVLERLEACPHHDPAVLAAEGLTSHVCIPLKARDLVLGMMNVARHDGRQFVPEELHLLTAIGHQVGMAVENARLYREVQQKEAVRRELLEKLILAQEEERKRVARELHDEIGQSLTALVMGLGVAEEGLPPDDGRLRGQVAEVRQLAARTLEETRRLMVDLRPTVLDDLGLIPAIQWYAETHLGRAGIDARVEVRGARRRLPPAAETALFRVVQEAVTNILRHAAARHATVVLDFDERSVRVEIRDDGRGFDPAEAQRGDWGLGLLGMQERVDLLGGRLSITSRPGQGTGLRLEIPEAAGGPEP